MTDPIPFHRPAFDEAILDDIAAVLRSGWWTTGQVTRQFEIEFAEAVGAEHALAVNSCTAALHLGLLAAGVGAGQRVITSVLTFTSTASVINWVGAEPLFVDVDPATLNLDLAAVEQALASHSNVAAVIPVHFAGLAVDMQRLNDLARQHGVPVIADAAHAFPTRHAGGVVGSDADFNAFSFYATKTLATGEGGMLTVRDGDQLEYLNAMRLHGIDRNTYSRYQGDRPSWYYEVIAPGYKYNLPDIAAAIGRRQLAEQSNYHARRQQIAARYDAGLEGVPVALPPREGHADHSWHLYVLRLGDGAAIERDDLIQKLADDGIGTSVHFIPLHRQPVWRDGLNLDAAAFPVAEDTFSRCISLPIYPELTDAQQDRVIERVRELVVHGR